MSKTRRNDARRLTVCQSKDIIEIQKLRKRVGFNKPAPEEAIGSCKLLFRIQGHAGLDSLQRRW